MSLVSPYEVLNRGRHGHIFIPRFSVRHAPARNVIVRAETARWLARSAALGKQNVERTDSV